MVAVTFLGLRRQSEADYQNTSGIGKCLMYWGLQLRDDYHLTTRNLVTNNPPHSCLLETRDQRTMCAQVQESTSQGIEAVRKDDGFRGIVNIIHISSGG